MHAIRMHRAAADCRLAGRTRSVEVPTLTVRKAAILSGEAQIATSTHLPTHQPAWLRLFIPARSSSPPLVSITPSSPPLRSIRTRSAPQHHPHTLGAHLRSPSSLSAHHTLGHSAVVCIAHYPHPHPRRLPDLNPLVASRAFPPIAIPTGPSRALSQTVTLIVSFAASHIHPSHPQCRASLVKVADTLNTKTPASLALPSSA